MLIVPISKCSHEKLHFKSQIPSECKGCAVGEGGGEGFLYGCDVITCKGRPTGYRTGIPVPDPLRALRLRPAILTFELYRVADAFELMHTS